MQYKSMTDKYLFTIYKGKFIPNLIINLLCFDIPKYIHIHPIQWIQTGGGIIKGIFWAITSFLLASITFKKSENKILIPFLTAFIYIYLQLKYCNTFQNELYTSFYCFVFPYTLFILFWNVFIKKYLSVEKNINKILIIILGILLGSSSEITAIASFGALLFISIFAGKNNKQLLIYSYTGTIIGNIIYFLNPGFIESAQSKGTFIGGIKNTIQSAILIYPEYIEGYKDTFIHYFLSFAVIIILLSIIVYYVKKEKNKLILIYSFLFGGFFFFTLLIFAGRPMHHSAVVHYDLIIQMEILFMYIILLEISFLENNRKIFYPILLITCGILINPYFNMVKDFARINDKWSKYSYYSIEDNENHYINERILAYYAYRNIRPIINDTHKTVLLDASYITSIYNSGFKFSVEDIEFKEKMEEVIQEYKDIGGPEINQDDIKEANYQKLLDKDFVLGKKSK